MSTKIAILLKINSLRALPKVHVSPNSFDSITTRIFEKNLSTAIERLDFRNPNSYGGENDPNREVGQVADGFHGGNPRRVLPNPEFEVQRNQNFQIGNFSNTHSGNLQQNPNGFHCSNINVQNSNGFYGYSSSEPRATVNGHYGENAVHQGAYFGGNVGNPNGYFRGNVGEYQQNPNGDYNPNVAQFQNTATIEEFDGFCNEGKVKEAMEVLRLLEQQGTKLNLPRYIVLMNACGEARALEEAKSVHEHLMRSVSPLEISSYNKILEMYGKCDSIEDAYKVFDAMPMKNLTSWDTMITALAKNGQGEEAIELFTKFKETGLKPDGPMFVGVLYACGVVGGITEGMLHFESMSKDYGIVPSMENYVSVIDMLGSNGYLDEALEFIEKLPVEPTVDVWETLMNHCRVYGNTELGDRCAELVQLLDPSRLNEHSKAGLIPVKASDLAKEKEKKKLASQNLLEARSRVHEYRAGDTSHPEKDRIYTLLRGMREQMKESGYVAEVKFVLHDIDQEGKEEALLAHSERLAVAHGLMSSPARSPIRIIKNLRVCGDCHSALKIISKLVGRELIIRDAKRFHHFKDGLCSCRDYW